jgi:acetyltransferase-like isoleucine patch superfamily enzyme
MTTRVEVVCSSQVAIPVKRRSAVELAAVVMVPDQETLFSETQPHVSSIPQNSRLPFSSRMPILGNDVLRSWMERVRKLGVRNLWVAPAPREEGWSCSSWAHLAKQGIKRLLTIKLKSYAEMDLADLLRFHCEKRNPITEAHDAQGQLGVSLVDCLALSTSGEKYADNCLSNDSAQIPYRFHGYAKRIFAAKERQELVGDALTGACAMRPFGTEIREQVWIGEDVRLADSVRIIGPTYIGAHTVVRAGATIGPFASVERDCVIDSGTAVERSTILPCTYLAPGLRIQNALVDGRYLEDLRWGAVADLQPAGLSDRVSRRGFGTRSGAGDLFAQMDNGGPWVSPHLSMTEHQWRQVRL